MKKYASEYGKKILAVALAVAMVITTASFNYEAKAAYAAEYGGYGDGATTSLTISSGGHLGEVITCNNGTEQVSQVAFRIMQTANINYDYSVTLYENLTDPSKPQSGVKRTTYQGKTGAVTEDGPNVTTVNIDDGIILTSGETLGVVVKISGGGGAIPFFAQASGDGFRTDSQSVVSSTVWDSSIGNVIKVSTNEYSGSITDVTEVELNPDSTIVAVGDPAVALNPSITPAYKRAFTYHSSDSNVIEVDGGMANINNSGVAKITATCCGVDSDPVTMHVLDNTVVDGTNDDRSYPYTGAAVKPTVVVTCGADTLEEGKDYKLTGYTDNVNPGTVYVTIVGQGDYLGYEKTLPYTIGKGTITSDMVTSGVYGIDTYEDELTSVTITDPISHQALTYGQDFTASITEVDRDTSVTSIAYTIEVVGINNYQGTQTTVETRSAGGGSELDINDVVEARFVNKQHPYTGNPVEGGEIKFYKKGTDDEVAFSTDYYDGPIYTAGADYTSASTTTPKVATVNGKGGFTGKLNVEYYVMPRALNDSSVTITIQTPPEGKGDANGAWLHTGQAIKPTATITYNNGTISKELVEGTDYTYNCTDNTDVGTAGINIVGKGNFTGAFNSNFTIVDNFKNDVTNITIGGYPTNSKDNFETAYSVQYKGSEYKPKVTNFQLNNADVSSGDYSVSYEDNVNAGTGKVIITPTADGKYKGQEPFTCTFSITKKKLQGSVAVNPSEHIYDGTHITLTPGEYNVYLGTKLLTEDIDYEISYDETTNVNAGTATIKATGINNYEGTVTGTFTIKSKSISDTSVEVESISDQAYTGGDIKPTVLVKDTATGKTLTQGSDYSLSYANNRNVAKKDDANAPTVIITGMGNYSSLSSRNEYFTITPKSLDNLKYVIGGKDSTRISEKTYDSDYEGTYTGLEVKPSVAVYSKDGSTLIDPSNYSVTYENNVNITTGTSHAIVHIVGQGAYAGEGNEVSVYYKIVARNIKDTNIVVNQDKPFVRKSDNKLYPNVTITDPTAPAGQTTLVEDKDYEFGEGVSESGPNKTVTVKGIGNYTGETTVTFNAGYDLAEKGDVELWKLDNTGTLDKNDAGISTINYIGENRPIIKGFYDGGWLSGGENTDYTISTKALSGADYAAGSIIEVTITGKGDYYGSKSTKYTVTPTPITSLALSDGNPAKQPDKDWIYTYNGSNITVTPSFTYKFTKVDPFTSTSTEITVPVTASDYTSSLSSVDKNVVWDGNIVGTTPVTFSGKVNYSGTRSVNYKVEPFSLKDDSITVTVTPLNNTYDDGKPIEPAVSVSRALSPTSTIPVKPDEGYTVSYSDNTEVGQGTAKATVTALEHSNYIDSKTAPFNIVQKAFTYKIVSFDTSGFSSDYIYDNTAKTPGQYEGESPIYVYYDNGLLTEGKDYTVEYVNNIKVGVGSVNKVTNTPTGPCVKVTGKGAYTGSLYAPFTIKGNISQTEYFEVDGLNNITVKYKLTEGTLDKSYYELEKPLSIAPGTRQITIKGVAPMYSSQAVDVTLTGSLADQAVSVKGISETGYDYTGAAISPNPTVNYGTTTLQKGVDYDLEYEDNTGPGTAKLRVVPHTGVTYLTEFKQVEYKIQYNLNNVTASLDTTSYDYTGSEITPLPVVKWGNTTLANGTDYKLVYTDNINAGNASVTIVPLGGTDDRSKGSKSLPFKIYPVTLTDSCTVTFEGGSTIAYDGEEHALIPTVVSTTTGQTLVYGKDYTVKYPADITNVGDKTITITGIGNYTGSKQATYTIGSIDITEDMVYVGTAYYAGGELDVLPPYSVEYKGTTLTEGVDYEVTVTADHRDVGTDIPIKFTGKKNLKGAVTKSFDIKPADLAESDIEISEASSVYDGTEKTPTVKAEINTHVKDAQGEDIYYTLDPDKGDYTIEYIGDPSKKLINAGSYKIKINGNGTKFINYRTKDYVIEPKSIEGGNTTMNYKTKWDYTGTVPDILSTLTVTDVALSKNLAYTTDYTLTLDNDPSAGAGHTFTVTGTGNYTGSVQGTYSIGHDLATEGQLVIEPKNSLVYNGMPQQPSITVYNKDDLTKPLPADMYTVSIEPTDRTSAGTKTVTVDGVNGWYGTLSDTYNILQKTADVSSIKIDVDLPKDADGYYTTYTGSKIEPAVTVYDTDISSTVPMSTDDYYVTYENETDVSKFPNQAKIRVHLRGNYSLGADEYTESFTIKAKTVETGFDASLKDGTVYPYTGDEVKPELLIYATDPSLIGHKMVEGEDYTLEYKDNIKAGAASVTVTGIGNFSGEIELPFNIVASFADADIDVEDQFYTGEPVYAPVIVECGGNILEEGEDYRLDYWSDNNYTESATVTITPLSPYYSGDARKEDYKILFDPSLLKVTATDEGYPNFTYTGKPIKPNFVVKTPDGTEATVDKSGITYYNSSTGAGDTTSIGTVTATIPVTIGERSATVEAKYYINSKTLDMCRIVPIKDNYYTGSALKPTVIILNENNVQLKQGVDYSVTYSNNINPGKNTGKVNIVGLKEYTGTATATFSIIAPNVYNLTGTAVNESAIQLSWLKNNKVTGYEVYSGDEKTKLGTTKDSKFTVVGLSGATNYQFKVRSYVVTASGTTYGAFTSVDARTGVGKPTISGTSYGKTRATVQWNGATTVSGYEIYRSTTANGTFRKIAVMPATAGMYSDSGLTSGSTYYYRVRAYDKLAEDTFAYGEFSDVIPITVR